jgi:hypothetical protein
MIEINVKADIKDAVRYLDSVQKKRIPIATQRALIATARSIRAAEIKEMNKVFNNPTRWTLGAMKVGPQKNYSIAVGILDPDGYYKRANYYLGTQVDGGVRRTKAFERALQRANVMPSGWYAVPGDGAKIDSFGNMGPGEIRQIMSWFSAAEPYAGSTQNMTEATRNKRRKGTKKKYGFEYFAAMPGSRMGRRSWVNGRSQNLQPGIYRRTFFGFGSAIKPILIFVPRVSYGKRFNFEAVARKVYEREFGPHFVDAFKRDETTGRYL